MSTLVFPLNSVVRGKVAFVEDYLPVFVCGNLYLFFFFNFSFLDPDSFVWLLGASYRKLVTVLLWVGMPGEDIQ